MITLFLLKSWHMNSQQCQVRFDSRYVLWSMNQNGCLKNLHFSLSHSGDWMVVAVARGVELGVDLEIHDLRRDVLRLARRFFAEMECRDLLALEGEDRVQRFYDLWTLREARVKALGGTLGREMERVAFRINDADPVSRITVQPVSEDAGYCLYSSLQGYSLALCILSALQAPPRFSLQELSGSGETRTVPGHCRASSVV